MSLKNRPDNGATTSITTRLTLLHMISTLLILISIITFLVQTMVADLKYEDNDFLNERLISIQALITRHPDSLNTIREHVLIDYASKHTRYMVRIQDAAGATLLESPDMDAIEPLKFPAPVLAGHQSKQGRTYQGSDGKYYLLNAVWAGTADAPHLRQVQVALDITEDEQLITGYRLKTAIALLLGLCLSGGLGIIISRKELRPLHQMAATVTQITATDLHQRVGNRAWPKEFSQLTSALDSMLGQLETSFARLSEFSANLAHELRTPINNLRIETEVALSRPRTAEEYRQTIESSIEEYERLSRMIGDILFLARPEQGIALQTLDARAELELLIDYYQPLAEERKIALKIYGNGTVTADPRLFQRAAGNLLANALYYTPEGGEVLISITPAATGEVAISVQDNGEGIATDEIPLVFDRFYRSAQARQQHREGSGLGLAIVRSIMELHHGSVTLTSTPGHGTTVTLQFPTSI